jgi:formamidopyrimidine-DNA glycosylase
VPELPEVETLRRDLERTVLGRRIASVQVTGLRSVRRHISADDFAARVTGRTITSVHRHGKYLLLALDDGADRLVAHMRMSGQLLSVPPRSEPLKHTHVVLAFDDEGPHLRFVDPRTFGELFVAERCPWDDAPDALGISLDDLRRVLAGRTTGLKVLLMDQRRIAGVGNIYSDEALWRAGLRGDRPAGSLRLPQIRRLHQALTEVLDEAVEQRGSSLADAQYRDLFGQVGNFASRHAVYARENQPCLRCGRPIVRRKVAGRSHFSCPRCQR